MKKHLVSLLAVIWLEALYAPTGAYAQTDTMVPSNQPCSAKITASVVDYWRGHLSTEQLPHAENVQRSLCKINPANSAETIVAIGPDDGADENAWTELAIVDNATYRVIAAGDAQLVGSGPEGIGITPVHIDTARYDLANGVRAFGLDVQDDYSPSCGDGFAGPALYLYVREGRRIRPVLKGVPLSESRLIERANDRCSGAVDPDTPSIVGTKQLFIAMAPTSSHGYHDFRITAVCTRDPVLDNHHPGHTPVASRLLHYNGKEYSFRWEDELFGCEDGWYIDAVVVKTTQGTSIINNASPKTFLPSTPVQIVARESKRVLVQSLQGMSWWLPPDAIMETSAFKRVRVWHGPATFNDNSANGVTTYRFRTDGSYTYDFEASKGPSRRGTGHLWEYGSIIAAGSNDAPAGGYFWSRQDGSLCDAGQQGCREP